MTKPFTQKHFGKKGTSTDDSNTMTKQGAVMMKQAALYQGSSKGGEKEFGPQNETKEEYGKRKFSEATKRQEDSKKARERRSNAPKEKSMFPKITSGMGSSFKSHKGPQITTGIGTSFKTRNKG
tara:strand:- start:514 stop:885 length:372 start_codon:yes stop_codon:yes gene_type:complete